MDTHVRQNAISENLTHLEQSSHKKKKAQEIYYENNLGRSPMMKGNRPSVHQRLGNDQKIKLRRMRPIQNQYYVKPRVRMQKEGIFTKKYRNLIEAGPKFSAQRRLDTLRKSFVTTANANGKIVLRRRRLNNGPIRPVNLQVEVKNTAHQPIAQMHSVQNSTDPRLQEEIRLVQLECKEIEMIPNLPIHLKTCGATLLPMNVRFSNYP